MDVVAEKATPGQTAVVNVQVQDFCGSMAGFDPVFTHLAVQQGGVARESFDNIPAAERYIQVINGSPGLRWVCLVVNGHVFALNPLVDGQTLIVDVGSAMQEGPMNVVTLAGQGAAGASAAVTIGDQSIVKGIPSRIAETVGQQAERWLGVCGAPIRPLLRVASNGGQTVLIWSEVWDGFEVQSSSSLGPRAQWLPVAAVPVLANGEFSTTIPSESGKFYRLHRP